VIQAKSKGSQNPNLRENLTSVKNSRWLPGTSKGLCGDKERREKKVRGKKKGDIVVETDLRGTRPIPGEGKKRTT
jgi:hypothetical protein